MVTRSSDEVEFRAIGKGICELLWLMIVLKDVKIKWESPMKLHCDNKSVINNVQNPVQHDRSKDIEID